MNKLSQWISLSRAMGMRYVSFRLLHEARRRSRLLKRSFPVDPPFQKWITLEAWRKSAPSFFFQSRYSFQETQSPSASLMDDAQRIFSGQVKFFHGEWMSVGPDEWLTNPVTGVKYDPLKHWTEIPDFDPICGDIKYVWEKSRFGFLQTILRYDAAYGVDTSEWVFRQMESWIDHNPINRGPNYRCSQETSLRLFNWILALYFYRHSEALTAARFEKILFHIYWQIKHVRANIHFSRIAVRNNHAITETLALYTCGLLFPFFKEAGEWKTSGKKWFEEEIAYQIYPDGTYLQFSANYHRVVVQLLTWAISLAKTHQDAFREIVYERAYASVNFLLHCQDSLSGELPNYGANDGSLFFHWSDASFRDYRPALGTLHFLLTDEEVYGADGHDDRRWFGIDKGLRYKGGLKVTDGTFAFEQGGVYIYREDTLLLAINCVQYKDRPQQADNLHLDLWYNGRNVLWDAGSYRYNASPELVKYFFGTESHNTVMLDHHDQMLKANRFIWLGWSRGMNAGWRNSDDTVKFIGAAKVFSYLGDITHTREVLISGKTLTVTDHIEGKGSMRLRQLWHINPEQEGRVNIQPVDGESDGTLQVDRFYSPTYGVLEKSTQLEIHTLKDSIATKITLD